MKNIIKNNWFGLITIILSAVILTYTIIITGGLGKFIDILHNLEIKWIAAALLAIVVNWTLDGIILNKLTRANYKRYPVWRSIITGMVGLFYNAITPFATGGQPMQIYEMSKTGIKSGDACSFMALKTIIYQVCMVFYACIALILTGTYFLSHVNGFWLYVGFGLICNGVFVAVIFIICLNVKFIRAISNIMISLAFKVRLIKDKEKALKTATAQIDVFYASVNLHKKRSFLIFVCVVFTLLQLTAYFIIPYCIFSSMGLSGDSNTAFYMICANAVITMVTAFIPLPGASGAAEGSFYLFFGYFFPAELKLPAVVIWRVITYYCCIIIGTILSVLRLTSKKVKQKVV